MLHSDLVEHLASYADRGERLRELRYLIETNPNVRALVGDMPVPTVRGCRGSGRTEPAYVGDGHNMRHGTQGKVGGQAWWAWNGDRTMPRAEGRYERVNSTLTYLDNTQGGSTGVFLPDAPPPKCDELRELMACG